MTSPRRRQDRPIVSVSLRITFGADRRTRERILEVIPEATAHGGGCEVTVEGKEIARVAERLRLILEKVRSIE